MNIADLVNGDEENESYKALMAANLNRHYDFLTSIIKASIEVGRPFLSTVIVKSLNYHAIIGLHDNAGEYRTMAVHVADDDGNTLFQPPPPFQVQSLMDDCINLINWQWSNTDFIELAATALWRINLIHPFVNGNGRTARAVCYFILCVKAGGLLPGETTLPELLRQNRDSYTGALREADQGDLQPLQNLLSQLLYEQVRPTANE